MYNYCFKICKSKGLADRGRKRYSVEANKANVELAQLLFSYRSHYFLINAGDEGKFDKAKVKQHGDSKLKFLFHT